MNRQNQQIPLRYFISIRIYKRNVVCKVYFMLNYWLYILKSTSYPKIEFSCLKAQRTKEGKCAGLPIKHNHNSKFYHEPHIYNLAQINQGVECNIGPSQRLHITGNRQPIGFDDEIFKRLVARLVTCRALPCPRDPVPFFTCTSRRSSGYINHAANLGPPKCRLLHTHTRGRARV